MRGPEVHRRRTAGVVVSVAMIALALLPASPAVAASAAVTSPSSGSTVDDATPVRVMVQRSTGESISGVSVRLIHDGQIRGTATLSCQSGCGGMTGDQVWGGVSFDPSGPRAFGISGPLPNGDYTLEASSNGGPFQGASRFLVSTPASPVAGLAARVDGDTIRLGWQLPPEPDVLGHVLERRRDGGSWSRVADLGANATSYTDTVSGHGTYTYRVFTSRPDGRGGKLTAVSANADAEVAPPPSSSPSPDGSTSTSGPSQDTETTSGDTTSSDPNEPGSTDPGTGSDDAQPEERTAGPATADEGDGEAGDSTRARTGVSRRVAPPPSVRRSVMLSTQTPSTDAGRGPEVAPERHYGDDHEFAEELDYGEMDPITGEPRRRTETHRELVRRPLAVLGDAGTDPTRAMLVSAAAGLLFITVGLHLFRWMRET